MAGILSDGSGNDKIYLAELNSNGSLNLGFTTKTLDINIGDITSFDPELLPRLQKITAYPSRDLGYVIAANSVASGNPEMVLTKIDVEGNLAWQAPVILGGVGEDYTCAVYELSDGRILVFGTMQLGDDEQSKMALIKLNSKGEFKD